MILEQPTSQPLFQPNTNMQWQHRWLYMKMLQWESYRKEWLALYRKCQSNINNNEKYMPSSHKVPSISINCNFTASILSQGSTLCMILSTVNKLYLLMLKYLLLNTHRVMIGPVVHLDGWAQAMDISLSRDTLKGSWFFPTYTSKK